MACRKGSRDCGDACSVMGEGVMDGCVSGGGVRSSVTCGASFPLLSTAPFVQESWRKDLVEGGRGWWREGGRKGRVTQNKVCIISNTE